MATLKQRGKYLDGYKNGIIKCYFEDGGIESICRFDSGVEEGEQVTYYPNGTIRRIGDMNNGQRHGLWKFYNEKGHLTSEMTYQNGIATDQ